MQATSILGPVVRVNFVGSTPVAAVLGSLQFINWISKFPTHDFFSSTEQHWLFQLHKSLLVQCINKGDDASNFVWNEFCYCRMEWSLLMRKLSHSVNLASYSRDEMPEEQSLELVAIWLWTSNLNKDNYVNVLITVTDKKSHHLWAFKNTHSSVNWKCFNHLSIDMNKPCY